MPKRFFNIIIVFIFLSVLFKDFPAAADGNHFILKIGLLPEVNRIEQRRRYIAVADYLSKKINIPVTIRFIDWYDNAQDELANKRINAVFSGSFLSALMIKGRIAIPLCRPVFNDGISTYSGVIAVRKDSGINSFADMRGKSIVLVKDTSAGHFFPLRYFKKQGVDDISEYFSSLSYVRGHDQALWSVFTREIDIACAKNRVFDSLSAKYPKFKQDLKVIWQSEEVPSNTLFLSSEVPAGVSQAVKNALLNMHNDKEGTEALAFLGARRFIATEQDDFKSIIVLLK